MSNFDKTAEALRFEKIAAIKKRLSELCTEEFGKIEPLVSPFPAPEVYPRAGSHPRILVTPETLPALRAKLSHPENRAMYEKYIELSEVETDGVLKKTNGYDEHNMDYDLLTVIESKAFRYLTTGDELYGYEAVLAIQNFILTLSIPLEPVRTIFDYARAFGYAMYISACVYDWCFDLLTPEDCARIVAAVETRLAPNLEVPYPPTEQGSGVVGHATEAQLYRDWLSVAVAVADEYPDVYDLVAGRIYASHRDGANHYLQSGAHWQGSSYGPYRYQFLVFVQILFSRMTGGSHSFFNDGLHRVAYFLLQTLRPDGVDYPMGDGRGAADYRVGSIFYAASLYRDPVLKGFAKKLLKDFTLHTNRGYTTLLTPAFFLCLNDPSVVPVDDYEAHLPLVAYFGSPRGNIVARSARKDRNAASVYMKIGETFSGNHEHRDAGHFMIYYKGMLAIDSGVYASHYGCKHDYTYLKQSISHNCMLVYNPALDNSSEATNMRYSGGQTRRGCGEPIDLDDWKQMRTFHQAEILGVDYKTADEGDKYLWSYLAGDLTNAYDGETVEEASRYMLSIMTEDAENPMAFFVFDRVTATDPTFKKTFLLHTPTAPAIDYANARATVTNTEKGNSGKLCVQTLLSDVTYTAIGGLKGEIVNGVENETDRQFWVIDQNYYAEDNPDYVIPEQKEAGWGRIEISPRASEKTTLLLHAMYVTDAANRAEAIPSREIRGKGLVGAELFGKTVLFPESEKLLTAAASASTASTEGETEYFIAGLTPGVWKISLNGGAEQSMTVGDGEILCFRGAVGSLTLAPAL